MIGYPRTIRVDQGSEFVSRDLALNSPWFLTVDDASSDRLHRLR